MKKINAFKMIIVISLMCPLAVFGQSGGGGGGGSGGGAGAAVRRAAQPQRAARLPERAARWALPMPDPPAPGPPVSAACQAAPPMPAD